MKRAEFVNLKLSRERLHSPYLMLVFKKNELGRERLGIAVGKRTGKAVRRNRTKRLLREVFRTNRSMFPSGSDTLIVAKRDCSRLRLEEIEREIMELLSKRSGLKCAT